MTPTFFPRAQLWKRSSDKGVNNTDAETSRSPHQAAPVKMIFIGRDISSTELSLQISRGCGAELQ